MVNQKVCIHGITPKRNCKQCQKEIQKKLSKNYRLTHKEKIKIYYKSRKEKSKKYHGIYYLNHKKQRNEYSKKYHEKNPDKSKEYWSKRKRFLGFEPLNTHFKGCEAHHINLIQVIHIPKKLHHSIYHNVFTGKNMDKINALAFKFLEDPKV